MRYSDQAMTTFAEPGIAWRPQAGPQHALVDCECPEVFYGGSRGGGKTDGMLGKWAVKERRVGRAFNATMFRKTTVSSKDAIERSKQIYGPLGGKYNETTLTWRMPNGGRISFDYLDSIQDADKYQGRNLSDAWVEEAGQYPNPDVIFRLFGALRSASGAPIQMVLTGNPGGAGQSWIARRYLMVPFPSRPRILRRELPDGALHYVAVIPSRLVDNRILMESDPGYISRMHMVGKAALVKAWLDGDWSAIEGAFFDEWDEKRHVVRPFQIPDQWMRFRSMDWGSAKPFSVGWWAIASDDYVIEESMARPLLGSLYFEPTRDLARPYKPAGAPGKVQPAPKLPVPAILAPPGRRARIIPRGAMVRYREWYGASSPNVGLKLTNDAIGRGIAERERADRIAYGVLDPACFAEAGGPSIADQMRQGVKSPTGAYMGPLFRKADNTRIGKIGAQSGWMQMRARLEGNADGHPMLFVFSTCTALIETLPQLQHDKDRPEDLDCWVAGTMISTPRGERAIEAIMPGDMVDTPIGPRRATGVYLSGAGETIRAELSNGRVIQGTPHHKIFVEGKGLVALSALECHMALKEKTIWQRRLLSIAVSCIRATRAVSITTQTAPLFQMAERAFTAKYGLIMGTLSLTDGTSTTLTRTMTTTPMKISSAFRQESTDDSTWQIGSPRAVTLDRGSRSGVGLMLEKRRFGTTPTKCWSAPRSGNARAIIVDLLLRLDRPRNAVSARRLAARLSSGSMIANARSVVSPSKANEVTRSRSEPVRIVAVGRCDGKTPVYNLSVEDAALFYANGVLSSNTDMEDHAADECRYACMSRPYVRTPVETEKARTSSGYSAMGTKPERSVTLGTM